MNPRIVTRGSTPPPGTREDDRAAHKFDWYQATVAALPEPVISTLVEDLSENLGVPVQRFDLPKGIQGYKHQTQLVDDAARVLCDIWHGGNDPRPSVKFTSSQSPGGAALIRNRWQHVVSRADVACDVVGEPGLFEELHEWSLPFSQKWGIVRERFLADGEDNGSTIYFGSRHSERRVRIYQKGLEVAFREGRKGSEITEDERNTVRMELQYRPQKAPARLYAATAEPFELWAPSPWTADAARSLFAMDVQPISLRERRESNHERALRWMACQYAPHLEALLKRFNGDGAAAFAHIMVLAGIGVSDASEAA